MQEGTRLEAFFDGPQSWEEVDVEELERIAVNIARSAVPSTESLEVGARLAMQAAAMEAESADPLGLGRVDTRALALVREEGLNCRVAEWQWMSQDPPGLGCVHARRLALECRLGW